MDTGKETFLKNPRNGANILSRIFFIYTLGMFKKGYGKTLAVDDLYAPLNSDRSKCLGDRLEKKWDKHLKTAKTNDKKPSLLKVLLATFWTEILYLGVTLVICDLCLRLIQPLMLGNLLNYFRPESHIERGTALWYAGALVALNGLITIVFNQYCMNAFHYGMKIRAACCALVYRKALKLSKTSLGDTASGKIVNLLANDVSRFDLVTILIHHMWVAPTSAIIVTYFLYNEAGIAGIVGIIPVLLVVPLQSYTGKLQAVYRKRSAYRTDERIRLMDEIISGIQVIKMYAWEKPFSKIITLARRSELKIITKSAYIRGVFMAFNLFTTRVSVFCGLLTMALMREPITAAKVFVFTSYFGILAQTMSTMFVRGISEIAEVIVAIQRLQDFLTKEEHVEQNNSKSDDKIAICLEGVEAKWNLSSTESTLIDFNLTIERGKVIGVIGPVGSGKSSLLQALLGELYITQGKCVLNGSVAYATQEPWIFASSIRQNIVFGQSYDKNRYNEVVHACALDKDFKQFADGDLTLVGDRGASLSGGQKARINLARTVYRNADVYLLDDPLSAVDVHVAKHLYHKCVRGYLAEKTRILVTHQIHHLRDADEIIILKNGVIENRGTFESLYSRNLLPSEQEQVVSEERPKMARQTSVRSRTSSIHSAVSDLSIADSILLEDLRDDDEDEEVKENVEQSSKGKVKGNLLVAYLFTGSGHSILVILVGFLFLLTQVSVSAVDFFVSFFVNAEEFRNVSRPANSTEAEFYSVWTTEMCLNIYGGLILSLFVFAFARSMLFYKLAMMSSFGLHNTMFTNVINAAMIFFDTNPSGRILNKFAKDIGSIDEQLPKAVMDSTQILLAVAGSLILVSVVNPYFLILVAGMAGLSLIMRKIYLKSSKNIKRLEGMMRSPVFTHLNATLQGLTTIRAFQAQNALSEEFDKHQDYHTSAWFMFVAASSAFGFYLDVLCFLFISLVVFTLLLYGQNFGLKGGEVGLAITQAAGLNGVIQWGIRQSAEVTNQLMSVERVLEYEQLPKEVQPEKPKIPNQNWPDSGKITTKNLHLRYDENSPVVLRDLTIKIEPKEKIGIVGRTGAGKSSLIAAIFRLARIEGGIEIDGLDTEDLSLQTLRSKISIIPQDPVLFSGTLRYNLDPFEQYPDELLYKVLNEVELKDPNNIINRLENRVMDRGSNYSVGQRQLICLARAIIRNNKILVLDEATANVDLHTDHLIQRTIREKFANCTVLTVAHRLNTIMDSDKVLVMEMGTMVEYDHPNILLQNNQGKFYKMVMETGKSTSEQLKRIARENYQKKLSVPE